MWHSTILGWTFQADSASLDIFGQLSPFPFFFFCAVEFMVYDNPNGIRVLLCNRVWEATDSRRDASSVKELKY